ncbi:MAG TPA: hypothetical protein VGP72_01695 [Planctomycetota bacterium]|jgi:hypothetical protein
MFRRLATFILLSMLIRVINAGEFHGEVPLQTELKFSGPSVSVKAPLGLHYRPGYAFPLEVRVHNPGPEFRAQLFIAQGTAPAFLTGADSGPAGLRCGVAEPVALAKQATRVVSVPILGPPVSADLTLVLREIDPGGATGPLRFRSSLARVLRPLPPETRLILSCGGGSNMATGGALQEAVRIEARELPEMPWVYESLDLVVLADGSFRDASAEAKKALRQWLCGGGRLLIASNDALPAAITAGLLPLDSSGNAGWVGADLAWWERHAGLTRDRILAEKNNRPVYASLPLGFGVVAFLFPATKPEEATELGAAAVNHPVLRHPRQRLPDLRVQPDRFNAFAPGSLSTARRNSATLWAVLGAAALSVGLVLGFTSRSRWIAAGWPLVVTALLSVLLAHWFPSRDVLLSRVILHHVSLDGRALCTQELTLLESTQQPVPISANGPPGGSLWPVYSDMNELRHGALDFVQSGTRLHIEDIPVDPQQPLLLMATSVSDCAAAALRSVLLPGGKSTIHLMLPVPEPVHAKHKRGAWVKAGGGIELLEGLAGLAFSDAIPCDNWESLLRKASRSEDAPQIKAHAAALEWAAAQTQRTGKDALIVWNFATTNDMPLAEITGVLAERANEFHIWCFEAGATAKK